MKRYLYLLLLFLILGSCEKSQITNPVVEKPKDDISQYESKNWDGVKRAGIFYEIFVRSFADGNNDGTGDFKGITDKLDYLNELGVAGIWLTPINPSSSYHGYDVTDFKAVNPDFGTMADFEALINKAHSLNIKVILDFTINHTSKYHPWFTTAISTEKNQYRNYFLFAPSDDVSGWISAGKVPMTNTYYSGQWYTVLSGTINFKYMGMFSDWMPDLNYGGVDTCENSATFKSVIDATNFWLAKGVDGFRLDAVKHIYQNEDSDENPKFLEKFYNELKKTKPDVYLIGENLTGDYTKVAPYYRGLPALFNFDAWYKLIYVLENSHAKWFPSDMITMQKKFDEYRSFPINATKLSNHDEDRTLSRLNGDLGKTKMAAAILLTISGSPYIYYGEEIGMLGLKSNDDKNVREPFLWDVAASDTYRTKWHNPVYSNDATVSPLSRQKTDLSSIYRVYQKFIQLRNTYPALASGTLTIPDNLDAYSKNFMVFYRETTGEKLMVIHNVSTSISTYIINHSVKKAIADMGKVSFTKINETNISVTMPPYSSIIFEI
ncbi:MAG: alpha-amylase family glycosyl hydrolase [Bacteroidales bacterium]